MTLLLIIGLVVFGLGFVLTRKPSSIHIKYVPRGCMDRVLLEYRNKSNGQLSEAQSSGIQQYLMKYDQDFMEIIFGYTQHLQSIYGFQIPREEYDKAIWNFVSFAWPSIYNGFMFNKPLKSAFEEYVNTVDNMNKMPESELKELEKKLGITA